jgi:type I restriction enzyme, S subunit
MKDGFKPLKPKLRFPEFDAGSGWDAVNGDELFDLIDRRPAPLGLPILAITQEHGAIPRDEIDYHVSVTEASIASYKEVQPGDFIISLRSFQGGIEYSRVHGICSPAYLILRRRGIGSDDFFRHLFKSDRFIQQLTRNIEGLRDGKMISYKQFSEQLLPAPDPAEQRKIAECFTLLDEGIAAERRKLEALRIHKKGLVQQLFPREGETRPRLRFPEFGDSPEWTAHPLDEFVVRSFYGTSNSTSEKGQYPVLRMGNMVDGGLDISNLVYIDLDKEEFESIRLIDGDILLNRTNSMDLVGKISMFRLPGSYITASYIVTYRLDADRLDPTFCNVMLNTPLYQKRIKALARPSVSQANINPTTFRMELTVGVPLLPEQQRIAACLSSLDVLTAAQSRKLDGLRAHKKSLMQQLFPSPDGL